MSHLNCKDPKRDERIINFLEFYNTPYSVKILISIALARPMGMGKSLRDTSMDMDRGMGVDVVC